MRVIVRRERPHPGAQLSLFEDRDGWRYTVFATNTTHGSLQWLEVRHRTNARVEDRIRCAKDTGLRRLPSREFAINQAWCTAAAIAADLIAWLQLLALDGNLALAEPKRLRYRILHTAARLVRGQRRRPGTTPAPGHTQTVRPPAPRPPPPAWPADNAAAGSASPRAGPGPTRSPPPSPGSRPSPHPADLAQPLPQRPEESQETTPTA